MPQGADVDGGIFEAARCSEIAAVSELKGVGTTEVVEAPAIRGAGPSHGHLVDDKVERLGKAVGNVQQMIGELLLPIERFAELRIIIVNIVIETAEGEGNIAQVPSLEEPFRGVQLTERSSVEGIEIIASINLGQSPSSSPPSSYYSFLRQISITAGEDVDGSTPTPRGPPPPRASPVDEIIIVKSAIVRIGTIAIRVRSIIVRNASRGRSGRRRRNVIVESTSSSASANASPSSSSGRGRRADVHIVPGIIPISSASASSVTVAAIVIESYKSGRAATSS
mmetsp:Transcript_39809/g.83684  ORF Transcript_39809/g.83684 Transcript_39809/m.83684 type:complete len:281 (+) Transcript_39809:1494-2336(+)